MQQELDYLLIQIRLRYFHCLCRLKELDLRKSLTVYQSFLFPTTPVAVAVLCYLINHGIPFATMSDDKDEIRT